MPTYALSRSIRLAHTADLVPGWFASYGMLAATGRSKRRHIDNGKRAERCGRKAMGLRRSRARIARLPTYGGSSPMNRDVAHMGSS